MDRNAWKELMETAAFHNVNVYEQDKLLQRMDSDCRAFFVGDNAAIVCTDNAILRVYWILKEFKILSKLMEKIQQAYPGQSYITEILFRGETPDVAKEMSVAGMRLCRKMNFMTRRACNEEKGSGEKSEFANEEDAEEIELLFGKVFDERISHLPTKEQLHEMIKRKEVQVIRKEGEVASCGIFQRIGAKSKYLFQLAVSPNCRRCGFGRAILKNEFVSDQGKDVYSLWVEEENQGAIALYYEQGFVNSNRKMLIFEGGIADGKNL